MKTIRCAGVPEHYNYPWQMALKSGDFEKAGLNVIWNDEPAGTGAMARDLRDDNVDLAIMLTEGALTDIVRGNPSKIVSTYVQIPLNWGVHTSAKAQIQTADDIEGKTFAISRMNSGSHLMAFLYGRNKGIQISSTDFNMVNNLDGARHALKAEPNQLFLWEKYTTKPLVDSGEFKLIDHCLTPWPSFMVVVRETYLKQNPEVVDEVLSIVSKYAQQLQQEASTPEAISKYYHIDKNDAADWFKSLSWKLDYQIEEKMLVEVSFILSELGILVRPLSATEIKQRILASPLVESV